MFSPQIRATFFLALTSLVHLTTAANFVLDAGRYSTVVSHHCIAWYCDGLRWDSLYRDARAGATGDDNRRRLAIGCGGITTCGTIGGVAHSCDEIPYASTYDGGLGCYAQRWTSSGRALSQLKDHGTHMCVVATENSSHGSLLSAFYNANNVADYERFNTLIAVGSTGCTGSPWCDRLLRANRGLSGETVATVCTAARGSGRQYKHVTVSERTQSPRCPSRGYRLAGPGDEEEDVGQEDTEFNVSSTETPRVLRGENGKLYLDLSGKSSIGESVWEGGDVDAQGKLADSTGISAKVVEALSYEEAFPSLSGRLGSRQTCK